MERQTGKVLVVGAGVSGIRAALDLAETGYEVLLAESSPAIGGILSKLDYQFPTDHCGMCRMLPFVGREHASQFCMRKSLFHDNITILPDTEVVACAGEPGNFEVTLRRRAKLVDTDVCIGDGECTAVCPIEVKDEFNEGLTTRKAIYRPVPHNLPNLFTIDPKACDGCGECVKVCPVGAIDLEAKDTEVTEKVGAVILAAGSGFFQADSEPDFFTYGTSPNVITSLEFERMLSASGTFSDTLRRSHDGKEVKRIAWLQCVGSRNRKKGRDYCSAVCCMFALKEAVLAKERGGADTEVTIFYMDMRTYGKEYYRYRQVAEEDKGVRLVRCRAHSVRQQNGDSAIRWFGSDGKAHEETFDLVVLATGQRPPPEVEGMRGIFGFDLQSTGFVQTDTERGVSTTAPGVFVCGSMSGLKDISEALIQASAASQEASRLLRSKGLGWQEKSRPPAERDVSRELPRAEVVLCRWPRKEGARGIDFDHLAEQVRQVPRVDGVHVVDEACRGGLEALREILGASTANRLIVGACLPYVYKQKLKDLALDAGFNPALVEIYDLRSHVRRLLHVVDGAEAEQRALEEVVGKVAEVSAKDAVQVHRVPVERRALVIGGGLAGMQAALGLSRHGIEVVLAERGEALGGHALKLHYTLEGIDPPELAGKLLDQVHADQGITVLTGAEVLSSSGSVGRFATTLRVAGQDEPVEVAHGATIVATGGAEATPEEYCYGENDSIITQEGLELGLNDRSIRAAELGTVVMIQCVGSREHGKREYCSRTCCSAALKNSLRILDESPDTRVIVLYRDMMAYGFKERFYTEARARGVIFTTYEVDGKPRVTLEDGKPVVTFDDEVLGTDVGVNPDLVVLSAGIVPHDNAALAEALGVELNEDGFFKELDYKWKPVETRKEGVFICGLAHSPRSIPESLVMAEAAAERALTVLSHSELATARLVSRVRQKICATCEVCIDLCPYDARSLDLQSGRIVVDELACQGCGICVAGCPSGAASFSGLLERQVMARLDAQLVGGVNL